MVRQIPIVILLLLTILSCHRKHGNNGIFLTGNQSPTRITFAGVGSHGIFDPSVALDPGSGRLWMSCSTVDPSVMWWDQNVDVVSIRLAYSDDRGKTWIDSGSIVSRFLDVDLTVLPPPNNAGTWVNEVSQLVYDTGAVPSERWKILWHHYLVINGVRYFEHGWLGMKTADSLASLPTATEIKLFAGFGYDHSNDTKDGTSGSPVGGPPLIQLDTLNSAPSLSTCIFSEPGMYATDTALYVSLQCEHLSDLDRLVVMLKCGSPCDIGNAASWSYLGTALKKSDAAAFGFDGGFAATGLFASNGGVDLVVTPVQNSGAPWPDYYSGCRIFRFANLDSALLESSGGQPVLIDSVDGTAGSFNGACAYHESADKSGMLYSQLDMSGVADKFRIFMSHTNF